MLISLAVVFFGGIGFFIISGILLFLGIDLFGYLADFFDNINVSILRIIGRVALLLVVMGFFMPIYDLNDFQITDAMNTEETDLNDFQIMDAMNTEETDLNDSQIAYAANTEETALNDLQIADAANTEETALNGFQMAKHAMNIDKSISVISGVGIWLYVLFSVSLIGGLMIIPLVINKKIHIGLDWVSLIVPIASVIVLLSKLKDITGGDITDLKFQVGGNFIIIGLIVSLLVTISITSFIPEKERVTEYISATSPTKKCSQCKNEVNEGYSACPHCGNNTFE